MHTIEHRMINAGSAEVCFQLRVTEPQDRAIPRAAVRITVNHMNGVQYYLYSGTLSLASSSAELE